MGTCPGWALQKGDRPGPRALQKPRAVFSQEVGKPSRQGMWLGHRSGQGGRLTLDTSKAKLLFQCSNESCSKRNARRNQKTDRSTGNVTTLVQMSMQIGPGSEEGEGEQYALRCGSFWHAQ